jgi:nucleotide-binding universal stress UspA family protein
MNAIEKTLAGRGIETGKILRSGYPDEEILKAADEFSASLIIIAAGGDAPSELSKAAAILLDGPERTGSPVLLLSTAGAA